MGDKVLNLPSALAHAADNYPGGRYLPDDIGEMIAEYLAEAEWP
jgi:hypothetical protein